MCVISLSDDANRVYRCTQNKSDTIIDKHSGIGKVPLGLFVLLVRLRARQSIEGETAQQKKEAPQVGRGGVFLVWALKQ